MTMEGEAMLRQSLDSVDRLRKRWTITAWLTAALSQVAWVVLFFAAERASPRLMILLGTLALAGCIFGGVFMLALHITRMTQRVLQAIDIASRTPVASKT